MELHVERKENEAVIVLKKANIIGTEAVEIQNTVLDLIQQGNKTIVVDLSKVDYITSWGVGILIYAHTTCHNKNIEFFLNGVSEKVMDILKKVKLDKIFAIKNTL